MGQKKEEIQNESHQLTLSFIRGKALYTGFIGGMGASSLSIFLYFFNFIEIHPRSFILTSWNDASWTETKLGTVISIILIAILSVLVAYIYYLVFKNVNSIWSGVIYGLLLWGIVFYALHPIFSNIPSLKEQNTSTIISMLSLYILYSVFIGYTISYDYAIYKHHDNNR